MSSPPRRLSLRRMSWVRSRPSSRSSSSCLTTSRMPSSRLTRRPSTAHRPRRTRHSSRVTWRRPPRTVTRTRSTSTTPRLCAPRRHPTSRAATSCARTNPFVKVKKMIKDLISKLMEEGTSETEHKGWCDTELTTNKQTRDKKTSEVNELESNIEDLTATIAQLTQDCADLTAAVKELDGAMATETEERNAAKATNAQTVKDAKAAQVAVEQAMAVLKDFYAKAAGATAFAQQPASDAPETFDKPYQGLGASGGNVVDFLEVILTDFSRLESETSASEAEEADEYKTFMLESKKDKALKENE